MDTRPDEAQRAAAAVRSLRNSTPPASAPVYASWQGGRKMSAAELRTLQLAFGMTNLELARYLDVDERSVRRYTTGTAVIPVPVALLLRALYYYDLAPWQPDKESAGGTQT